MKKKWSDLKRRWKVLIIIALVILVLAIGIFVFLKLWVPFGATPSAEDKKNYAARAENFNGKTFENEHSFSVMEKKTYKKIIIITAILLVCMVAVIFFCTRLLRNTTSKNTTNEIVNKTDVTNETHETSEIKSNGADNIKENETNKEEADLIVLTVNGHTLTAKLADNSSAQAFKDLLKQGPLTIDMRDYGNMEKVGNIGQKLPTNDEQIDTVAGDLILYLGSSFVIYYDTNSWDFTRLGKIQNVTQAELKEILGSGDVTVTIQNQ